MPDRKLLRQRVSLKVTDGTSMEAYTVRPDGQEPCPGVIVIQEAFGVNPHIRDVSDRLAQQGYAAIAPELFHRTAPPGFEAPYDINAVMNHYKAVTPATAEPDLRAAFDWLQSQAFVRRGEIVSVGFCMGGKYSFLANAALPLRAAASYYGGGIAPDLLDRASSLHAPMLLIWGGKDQHISPEQRGTVVEALRQHGKVYVNVEFSEGGHGFFCDLRPAYHAESARQSWPLLLEFFRTYLKP